MAWVYLVIAGLFEMGWAIGLKYTEGFTKLVPTTLTALAMVISVALLGLALRDLPVGTGYAVWTGIGTVGTALLGMYLFGDPATAARLGAQIGAKYYVTGKVTSNEERFDDERRVQYSLFLQVIEVETSLVKFQFTSERSKAIVR